MSASLPAPTVTAAAGCRARRRLFAAAVTAGALLLGTVGLAAPAQAATSGNAWTTACFSYQSTGGAWSGTTSEQYWTSAGWTTVKSAGGTSNGCRA